MTGLEQTAPEKETQPVEMPDDEVLYELAHLFRVFGDSTRIKILYALHDSELCVQDIADAVQLSQSAVSHQLRVLTRIFLCQLSIIFLHQVNHI